MVDFTFHASRPLCCLAKGVVVHHVFLLHHMLCASCPQREVLGAIAKGNTNKYTIDAKDLKFQVRKFKYIRDEKEERKKQASSNKQQGKATQYIYIYIQNVHCILVQCVYTHFKHTHAFGNNINLVLWFLSVKIPEMVLGVYEGLVREVHLYIQYNV